ncbi:TolB family protein [Nannocystis pusilla]|uniref:TolB family protein n=1 Tax=Nannocystis pusilla TaxID=889268 RepID=UPI003BF37510
MAIRSAPAWIVLTALSPCLAACGDDTATSGTGTEGSTGLSEGTDSMGSTGGPTSPTTGEGDVTRGAYLRFDEQVRLLAVRGVEIVDGVPQPPFDLLTPPAGSSLRGLFGLGSERWLPVTAAGADPAHFWLVDLASFAVHTVPVPPGSAFDFPRLGGDRSAVILPAAEGVEQAPFSVCIIDEGGGCPLRELDPLLPAGAVFDDVRELSASRDYVIYTTRPEVGAGFDVHFAALDAPDVPVTLASFPTATHFTTELAPDHKTVYLEVGVESESLAHFAVDVASEPPGPPIALHPPLQGKNLAATWAPDMSALLLFVGDDEFGDLHRVAVGGTTGGPPQLVHAAAPGHAFHSPAAIARFSPDAARMVYFSDHESPGTAQLYLVDPDAPGAPPLRLSGPLGPGQIVYDARFLPDPNRMVYFTTNLTEPHVSTIASVEFDAPQVAHTLNIPAITSIINAVHASADGARIVYSGRKSGEQPEHVLVDFSGDAPVMVSLADSLPPSSQPTWQGFSPSGRHFFIDLGFPGESEGIVMVPLDPVADAVMISEPGEGAQFFNVAPPQ